jgi:hypothetical protein
MQYSAVVFDRVDILRTWHVLYVLVTGLVDYSLYA